RIRRTARTRENAMSELTRRTMLSGAAAAAAIAPLAAPWAAFAAAPPAGTQVPGWYRYKVGNFEITVVTDGVNRFKLPDDLVRNVKKEEVNVCVPMTKTRRSSQASP